MLPFPRHLVPGIAQKHFHSLRRLGGVCDNSLMFPTVAKLISTLKANRRWLQFSVGTMFVAVTGICVWLADYVRPVRRLERQLRDPDRGERAIAAQRLGYMGAQAWSATKSLRRTTNDDSPTVRPKAVWALSRVSRRPDLLLPLLADSDENVRLAAAEGFLWTGGDPAQLFSTLLVNRSVDSVAWPICSRLGPEQAATVLPLLLDSLGSADPALRDAARRCLGSLSVPAPTAVPALVQRLAHARAAVRKAAAKQLLLLGAVAHQAASELRARLRDPDPAVSVAMAAALCAVDPDDDESLPVLRRSLRSGDMDLVVDVAFYLLRLGPAAAEASDDLVAGLCDPRICGAHYPGLVPIWGPTLKRLGPPAVSAVEKALNEALAARKRLRALPKELREEVRSSAHEAARLLCSALTYVRRNPHALANRAHWAEDLPERVRVSIECMLQLLLEQATMLAMPETRIIAVSCLGDIRLPARSVPALIAAVNDGLFRDDALRALGLLRKDAAQAVDHLLPLLDSDDGHLRLAVFDALEKIGACHDPARARLRPFLTSRDITDRFYAARALAASGEPAQRVVPTLIHVTADPHFNGSRADNLQMLASVASFGAAAVPELNAALRVPTPHLRRAAADALGQIGPSASASVALLTDLLDDPRSRDAAAEALGRIGHEAHTAVPKLLCVLEAIRLRGESSECTSILHALSGIGADARDALPAVDILADSDEPDLRHAAVMSLAKIDPANRSLIPRLRRLLAEWQRKSAVLDDDYRLPHDGLAQIADNVWAIGSRAERLVPDLLRLATAPVADPDVRSYAAFALARFAPQRPVAKNCLRNLALCYDSYPSNLPAELLERVIMRLRDVPADPGDRRAER